ncbi:hypothetical protein [Streptomyces sp. NPDC056387]|uniref:hypothetical protein n=1 Tax=Streptomyces sp. NPDC056387 TaxID=3345803 RepID=UPI0035E2C967
MTTPANAYPPAGWFQLRTTVQDSVGAVRAMDVLSEGTHQVDGTIRLAGAAIADQQRWKARLVSGSIGDVRLENKLTGQCISYTNLGLWPTAVSTPCQGNKTVFEAVPVSGGWVFQSKESFGDSKICLQAEPGFGPHFGHVLMAVCTIGAPYQPLEIWNAVPIP